MNAKGYLLVAVVVLLNLGWCHEASASKALAGHVVVFGIDGMTAKSLDAAATPNMHALMAAGASTLEAHTVLPTVSSPNWASMLMGTEPGVHGIHDNDWQPSEKRFPTIFTALHEAEPKAVLAVAYEWLGFGRLFDHKEVTNCVSCLAEAVKKDAPPDANALYIISKASDLIKEQRPMLTWIHIDLVDHAGHSQGYDSEEYNKTVSMVDGLLGNILKAADEAGTRQDTVFIVVSDHGGKETSHGGVSTSETRVPWIISGKGIAAGASLGESVSVAQTAPTIARILGVKAPKAWTAKPVPAVLR